MIDRLRGFGLRFVTLYGREPVLWDREAERPNQYLTHLIEWLSVDAGIRVCLCASGMDLGREVLAALFEHDGILFMKNWGGPDAVGRLMKGTNAYRRIRRSWDLVRECRAEYPDVRILAEFLYTGLNRRDLLSFWEASVRDDILPFVEVPVIQGTCVANVGDLRIDVAEYVRDIYAVSVLNLRLLLGMTEEEAKSSDRWYPPYGSVFPAPCQKLGKIGYAFLERNGDMRTCCGVRERIGSVDDPDLEERLRSLSEERRSATIYEQLGGHCGRCDYSRRLRICYGCRGNACSYDTATRGFRGEDPMCFGARAAKMGPRELGRFMSTPHVEKLMECFGATLVH